MELLILLLFLLTAIWILFFCYKKSPKWIKITLGTLVGAVFITIIIYSAIFRLNDIAEDNVIVSVQHNIKACSKDYPLLVIIDNESGRTVIHTDAYLIARVPGHSDNIVKDYPKIKTDKIIPHGHRYTYCRRHPVVTWHNIDNIDKPPRWSVEHKDINFK